MRIKQVDVKDWDSVELWAGDERLMIVYWDRDRRAIAQIICGKMSLASSSQTRPGEITVLPSCLDSEPAVIKALREEGL